MSEENLNVRWREGVAGVGAVLRRGFSQFLGFEVLFRILGALVFAPLTAWLSALLIAGSGDGAVSNYDLTGFFLSPNGLAYLTVVITVAFALLFFEFGGLLALAIALQREEQVGLPLLLRFLGVSLLRLWKLAVRQFLIYAAYALPCLAVAGGAYLLFLTKSDIYYYLTVKPAEYWYAVVIVGVAGLTFAAFAIRLFIDWVFSMPILLLTDATPAEAMRRSKDLVRGQRREMLLLLLGWGLAVGLALLILWGVMGILNAALLGLAGDHVGAVLALTSILAVIHFIASTVVTIAAMSGLATVIARAFLRCQPEIRLPETVVGGEPAVLQRITRALRASWAVLFMLVAAATAMGVLLLNRVEIEDRTGITAHRGSSITAPENTMAAIMLAVEEGADYVEIDVQETSDGVVVLCHDKDLKRVFDMDQGIWEVTYEEIKDLDSGSWFSPEFSDQRICTLDQVIDAVWGKAKLNIELKFSGHEQKLASEVVRILNEKDFVDQCNLTSLDYAGILRAREADPDVRTGIIVTSAIGDITTLEAELLSIGTKAATRDLIAKAGGKDLEVHVWTVNDVPTMNAMIGRGVDQIITDDPKLLGKVLAERAEMSTAEKLLLQFADLTSGR